MRRLQIADADMRLDFNKVFGGSDLRGVFVINNEGAAPDTIFSGLSGVEFRRLQMSLTQLSRTQKPDAKR